ncbi:helix-turn-helix domain-containing protein [Runella zeae]|jgi:HTH-type transcriptional regulator/antitoxin HigA|uniref:helix-turn-helix domain-containing protein n=1 Tax=Runella zeae TaxID=94255 RepID=UPI0003FCF59A|nr:helix-turn-helix domain-containing protein [Runella zeae]
METIRPIKTEQEYELALERLSKIFHAKPSTPEGDLLEVLSLLIHEYEQKHHKIEILSPLEALKYEMEEQGLSQTGLAKRAGMSKSTISEIMNGKKQMSLNFLKFLHNELGIPAHILLAY